MEPVPEKDIETMLEAAMAAPSAGNVQPWRFVVIDDQKLLGQVVSQHPYATMSMEAPLGILICSDGEVTKHQGFWPQSCAAAMQNLLLSAHAMGYGGLWCGIYPIRERELTMRTICQLPQHITPCSLALIGKAGHPLAMMDRYDPGKIHRNTW
jgi:nitroreductase